MSDDDYRDAAVINKYYTRNGVYGTVRLIRQGDERLRDNVQYANGRDDVGPDNKRHTVRVRGRYATRRNGIMIQYEMATPGGYFTNSQLQVKLRTGPRGPNRLYGPYESTLENFHRGFDGPVDGPYDNPGGTNNTSSSSTTTTIDLRTPTKQSTPLNEGEDLRELETITEEESLDRQLKSAQKKRTGLLGEGGKAGYVDLVTPSSGNNNNNVKKRAHVSSGSGPSSSGSSEGGVDPNHPSQRQPKRRIMSNPNANIEQEYTRWVSADVNGDPIIMHRDNVVQHLRGRHIRVRDIVWLASSILWPDTRITGPYTVLEVSRRNYFGRSVDPRQPVTIARIKSLTTDNEYEVSASRLMDIIPSTTSNFMFHDISLHYKFKTRWFRDMGLEHLVINPCDDEDGEAVSLRDRVLESEHLPHVQPNIPFNDMYRFSGRGDGASLTLTNISRNYRFIIEKIYHPWSLEALDETHRTGRPFWPDGGVLIRYRVGNNDPWIHAQILIKDLVLQLPPTLATYRLIMHGKEWPEGLQELHKLSLKF